MIVRWRKCWLIRIVRAWRRRKQRKGDYMTRREYGNLTDFLGDHADQLEDQYKQPPPETGDVDYTDVFREIDCVAAIMRALEHAIDAEGLDRAKARDVFTRGLLKASAEYVQKTIAEGRIVREVIGDGH